MPVSIGIAIASSFLAEAVVGTVLAEAVLGGLVTTSMFAFAEAAVGFVISGVLRSALSSNAEDTAETNAVVSDPTVTSKNRTVTIRQPIAPWQVIFGKARVGGTITYIQSSGPTLNLVITFAGHVSEEIVEIYAGDELVTLDGSGNATGRFAGYLSIQKSLGAEAAQPFPGLVTSSGGEWTTANHWQKGRTKIWVMLTANRDVYPNGVPNFTAVIKGDNGITDPRTSPSVTAYSNNAALCANRYLTSSAFGFGADYATEVNEAQLVAAANSCDEAVTLASASTEARYTCNGSFNTDATPQRVLGLLLGAMMGKAVNVGGQWYVMAGVYEVPTIAIDETDVVGQVRVQGMMSRRESCNGVKGLFTDPNSFWQPTSFPAVASTTYRNEDGGETVWRDVDMSPFVTSGTQAQRCAKIELLATRQGLSVVLPCRLAVWAAMTGRTIAVSNVKFGWNSKAFEIVQSRFLFSDDGNLGVELTLRETAAAVYDWATSEEQAVDIAPNSDLPDPFANLAITNLTATSGTADLFRQTDGTVVPRVHLRWTAPANPFVAEYEVQFERLSSSPTEWIDEPKALPPKAEAFIYGANDGEVINARVRARTSVGNAGDWAYIYGHIVIGKTEAPSDVTGANAVQQGGLVVMGCNTVTDADLDSVEVRLQDEGSSDWDNAVPVANILRGQTVTSAAIQPGTWNLLFKAKDTSGNYSATAAEVTITVTSEGFSAVASVDQAPNWLGLKTNMVQHWTGVLVPESQSLASTMTDAQLWDEFVYDAVAECYYEAPIIDKGIDATARIYADIVSDLGPGESGTANPMLEVDTRLNSGSFDGFIGWTVGSENFRFLKARFHFSTAAGKLVVSQFTPTIDAESRSAVGTYTTSAGGSVAVTFTTAFHSTPVIQITPQGSGDVSASWDALTATGFTGYFKSGGAAAAGTASYLAIGA